jgi:hypothetical protein
MRDIRVLDGKVAESIYLRTRDVELASCWRERRLYRENDDKEGKPANPPAAMLWKA